MNLFKNLFIKTNTQLNLKTFKYLTVLPQFKPIEENDPRKNFRKHKKLFSKIFDYVEMDELDWKIEDYLRDECWKNLLQNEFEKKYFKKLNCILHQQYTNSHVLPKKELVFEALNLTKFEDLKVIVIGQDPYHNFGQHDGLAFSVPKDVKPPPSLRNILLECQNDIQGLKPNINMEGSLIRWAKEGVLLLNSILTVEAFHGCSHSNIGWQQFTDEVVKLISNKKDNCVFFLWGNFAKRKEYLIDDTKHLIIKSSHPSPFSARISFFGSRCFSKANEFLVSKGTKAIDWSL